jgi:two-component system CheB/CheR fusion protein
MTRADSEMVRTTALPAHDGFTARIPRQRPADQAADDISIGAFRDMTVLLVEDDPVTREALELILVHYGARVLSAESMGEALAHYEREDPSIVISDIGLRQGDGYMLLRAIRARERGRAEHVPAIAVSGFPSRETGDRARQAGFDAFVRKPVAIQELLHLIHRLAVAC